MPLRYGVVPRGSRSVLCDRADAGALVVADAELDRELREGEPDWRSADDDVDPDDARWHADQ